MVSGQQQQVGISTWAVGGGQKTNEVEVTSDCLCVPSGSGCIEDKMVKFIRKSLSSKYVRLIGSSFLSLRIVSTGCVFLSKAMLLGSVIGSRWHLLALI